MKTDNQTVVNKLRKKHVNNFIERNEIDLLISGEVLLKDAP